MSALQKIESTCDNCQKPFILVVYSSDVSDAHHCPFCGEHTLEIQPVDDE